MAFFSTKKTISDPAPLSVMDMEEHDKRIGSQVMEALGVVETADDVYSDDEAEPSVLMPDKNIRELEAINHMNENTCIISAGTKISGSISCDGELVVNGDIKGDVSCGHLTCVGDSTITGNINCADFQLNGGKVTGNIKSSGNMSIDGTIEGNVEGNDVSFGCHASVKGQYISCTCLTVNPGAILSAQMKMRKDEPVKAPAAPKPAAAPAKKEADFSGTVVLQPLDSKGKSVQ